MLHLSRNKQEKHCHTCLLAEMAIEILKYALSYCNDLNFIPAYAITGICSCIMICTMIGHGCILD